MFDINALISEKIGEGGQGEVYLIKDSKKKICVKKVKQPALEERRGIELRNKLNHPSWVKTLYTYEDDDYFYHFMPCIEGKSLKDEFHQFSNKQLYKLASQFLEVLQDLKEANLTFNDFKPDNILMDKNGYIHIIDFGALLPINDETSTRFGSVYFASPEYLACEVVDWKSDLYSMSKVLLYLSKKISKPMKSWCEKATQSSKENRFSSISEASKTLNQFKMNLMKICLSVLFLIFAINIQCINFPFQNFDFTNKEDLILFYSIEGQNKLNEEEKMDLSNFLYTKQDDFYWMVQKALCESSEHELLENRAMFISQPSFNSIVVCEENIDFYIHYLFWIDQSNSYQDCLNSLISCTLNDKQCRALIEMAFYFGDLEGLKLVQEKTQNHELKALSYYYCFQLGYYQDGYLHQAKKYIQANNQSALTQKIEALISQWGERS